MKRPENSAHFPASHLPHPFPSKPRERRRTRSYKKPPQERSEEEAAEEEEEEGGAGKERGEDEPGASPGRCSPFLPWGRGRRGGGRDPAQSLALRLQGSPRCRRDLKRCSRGLGRGVASGQRGFMTTPSVVTDRWAPETLRNFSRSLKV